MSHSLRILVIDDDPVMRELLEALLGFSGHRIEAVDSGVAALARLASDPEPFDVVLTDLHMPVLQGKELARRLLETRGPSTLLVGMSGSSPSEEETQLLDEFLHKPFTPEQFEQALINARSHIKLDPAPAPDAPPADIILDEATFTRLAAMMPADQLRGLYTLTLDDVAARVERMRAAHAAGDPDTVHAEAHAIKGGCGMVGARELHHLGAQAESSDSIDFENFTLAAHRLRRMLDERLNQRAPNR